jgi:PKD repeat protein
MNYKLNIKGTQVHKLIVYSLLISSVLISSCKKDEPAPADTTTPTAGFTFVADELAVTFTNTSKDADTYSWDFGDSGSSTDASPSHTYSTADTYTVTLTATRSANGKTNTDTQTVTVAVAPIAPVAAFTSTIADLKVTFQNTSTNASTYAWKFGDGSTSTDKDPVHTYATNGTFAVELVATGDGGDNTVTKDITVIAKAAVAAYTSVANALEVTFTNTSTDATTYLWNFGDGSATSALESPTHTYAVTGTYDVSLTVSGDNPAENTDTESLSVAGIVNADFNFSSAPGFTINFTNTSTDALSYLWDFGDGNTSIEVSPSHTYAGAGTYTIKLVATGVNATTDEKSTEQSVN